MTTGAARDVASFRNPEYLAETDWLEEHLDDPGITILDVTAKLTADLVNNARAALYDPGHIPGSLLFDVASAKGELSDQHAALPWMWPSADQFGETMARFGIGNDTRVVLAARTPRAGLDSGTMWCTRAWWTMHHMGVDVAILRGGIEKWISEDRPMTKDEPTVDPATFTVQAGWERARADKHDVLAALDDSSTCVVDSLPASSFDGTDPGYGPRRGHIAGAVNLSYSNLIETETAGFLPPDEMKVVLDSAHLLDEQCIITYCGGAIAATVDAFAMALFGHDKVAVYDGSLMEWSADSDLPMVDPNNG
jgi:thiosulfate/3-mercaptopyruvate sulfurtransferase